MFIIASLVRKPFGSRGTPQPKRPAKWKPTSSREPITKYSETVFLFCVIVQIKHKHETNEPFVVQEDYLNYLARLLIHIKELSISPYTLRETCLTFIVYCL